MEVKPGRGERMCCVRIGAVVAPVVDEGFQLPAVEEVVPEFEYDKEELWVFDVDKECGGSVGGEGIPI